MKPGPTTPGLLGDVLVLALSNQFADPDVTHVEVFGIVGGGPAGVKGSRTVTRAEFDAAQAVAAVAVDELTALAIAYHKADTPDGEGEYGCNGATCPGVQRLVRFLQRVAPCRLAHGDVISLIERIVTGDGQQLENVSITDDEWRALALDEARRTKRCSEGYVDVTVPIEDWIALVRIARDAAVLRVGDGPLISETVRSEDFNRTIAASHALVTAPLPDLSPWASRCLIRNTDGSPTACGLKAGHGGERHDFTVNVPEMAD